MGYDDWKTRAPELESVEDEPCCPSCEALPEEPCLPSCALQRLRVMDINPEGDAA